MDHKVVFDEIVSASTGELFESLGLTVARKQARPPLDCVAVIGFTGSGIRGSLGLGMAAALRRELAPEGSDVEDWHAEIANQLLGRLKSKLLRYGAPIDMALPMVLRGVRLELVERDDLVTCPFEHATGWCATWLDVRLDPHVALEPTNDPDMCGIPEGEAILF